MNEVKLLKQLVEFPTLTSDKEANMAAFAWVKKQLKGVDLFIEDHVSLEHPSLVITTRKTKTPKLWLQAHMDVVPGSIEMFRPKEVATRLYGRGTYDMKFAIACYVKLLQDLAPELDKYDFGVMLTSDEEVGGFNGVKYLLDEGFASDVVLIPDAGKNWSLEESAKGLIHLRVVAKGKSGHAAYPWESKNAAQMLNDFLGDLTKRFVKGNASAKAHKTTCSITDITTARESAAVNQIPDKVEALVDIRPVTISDRTKVDRLLEKLSAKHKGIEIDILAEADPYRVLPSNGYLLAWNKAAQRHKRYKRSTVRSYGSSDARFFANKNIATIACRPLGGGIHSEKEWIDTKDLGVFYKVTKDFVQAVSRS